MTTTRNRMDIHQAVTDTIVAQLEAGAGECKLPWHRPGACSVMPRNASTEKSYNGINVLSLWATAEAKGYDRSLWATYRQWQAMDAQVRKDEKAALVVFYKEFSTEPEEDGDDGLRRVAKASWVFNVSQVDGYSVGDDLRVMPPLDRLARAEAFFAATGAQVRIGGENAFYRRTTDHIQMPAEQLFARSSRTEDWYSVLSHEHAHWTGAPSRLNREFGKRFGDQAYAAEELVAELSAAFICAELGISVAPRADHASYIGHWLRLLKEDKRAIFTAAARASEAAKYLAGFSAEVAHAA